MADIPAIAQIAVIIVAPAVCSFAFGMAVAFRIKQKEVDAAWQEMDRRDKYNQEWRDIHNASRREADEKASLSQDDIIRSILRTLNDKAGEKKIADLALDLVREKRQQQSEAQKQYTATDMEKQREWVARQMQSLNAQSPFVSQSIWTSVLGTPFKTPSE